MYWLCINYTQFSNIDIQIYVWHDSIHRIAWNTRFLCVVSFFTLSCNGWVAKYVLILTGWRRHICVSKLTVTVAWSAWSHYLNHCWNNVIANLMHKLQWNLKRNSYILIQENAFKMSFATWRQIPLRLNVLRIALSVSVYFMSPQTNAGFVKDEIDWQLTRSIAPVYLLGWCSSPLHKLIASIGPFY